MTQPIYVSKYLVTANASNLGSISTAASPAVTLNSSLFPLAVSRRIQLSSTTSISSGLFFTITGTIDGGGVKTETIYSSTGAAISTLDYLTVTSVYVSSGPLASPISIGTNNTGGTQWHVLDYSRGGPVGGTITFSSSSNGMTGSLDWTMDDPTGTWPIQRIGIAYPQPIVWGSSGPLTGATGAVQGLVNLEGSYITPAYAWRLTITSSSSAAGVVYATVLEQGP